MVVWRPAGIQLNLPVHMPWEKMQTNVLSTNAVQLALSGIFVLLSMKVSQVALNAQWDGLRH